MKTIKNRKIILTTALASDQHGKNLWVQENLRDLKNVDNSISYLGFVLSSLFENITCNCVGAIKRNYNDVDDWRGKIIFLIKKEM